MAQLKERHISTGYLAMLPRDRRERGEAIDRLVKKLFPKTTCDFSYRMPTYHVGEHFFAWKSQKNYLSVYTCSSERIAAFMKKHPEIRHGAGCINFRDRDPFPLHDLATAIANALAPPH
ncbi:MAG: hypothetical protein A4E19_20180 [Nitrospira sp. SG-bin1]|nr:MAG: hypothetical protein A4E19_20180 [Nitrospira sp. SG-bin1]